MDGVLNRPKRCPRAEIKKGAKYPQWNKDWYQREEKWTNHQKMTRPPHPDVLNRKTRKQFWVRAVGDFHLMKIHCIFYMGIFDRHSNCFNLGATSITKLPIICKFEVIKDTNSRIFQRLSRTRAQNFNGPSLFPFQHSSGYFHLSCLN